MCVMVKKKKKDISAYASIYLDWRRKLNFSEVDNLEVTINSYFDFSIFSLKLIFFSEYEKKYIVYSITSLTYLEFC